MSDVIPDNYADILDQAAFANVATIGPSGEPQNNPVWFDWDGEVIRFSQTKTRQKLKNLQQDPHIALAIMDQNNPYRYLEVRGIMVGVDDDGDNVFIDKMAKRYMDEDSYPFLQPGDQRVVVRVQPEHATFMG